MMKRAGIEISTLMVLIVAVVSIAMLLGFFSLFFPSFGRSIYCSTIGSLSQGSIISHFLSTNTNYCSKGGKIDVILLKESSSMTRSFLIDNEMHNLFYLNLSDLSNAVFYVYVPNTTLVNTASLEFSLADDGSSYKFDNLDDFGIDVLNDGTNEYHTATFAKDTEIIFEGNDFVSTLNSAIASCIPDKSGLCQIPIEVRASTATKSFLRMQNLNIQYYGCLVVDRLAADAVACFERGEFGKAKKSILCEEITVAENCQKYIVTEEQFTAYLAANNLCSTLPSQNPFGISCGTKNSVDFRLYGKAMSTNILIAYDGTSGKVVLS